MNMGLLAYIVVAIPIIALFTWFYWEVNKDE